MYMLYIYIRLLVFLFLFLFFWIFWLCISSITFNIRSSMLYVCLNDFHYKKKFAVFFSLFSFSLHWFLCVCVFQQNDRYHWSAYIHFHVSFTYRFGPRVVQNFLCSMNFSIILSLSLFYFSIYSDMAIVWNVYAGVWVPEIISSYAISSSTFQYNFT